MPAKQFNINFFKQFTSNTAYVVGWIASDGCISSRGKDVRIALKQTDKKMLEKIADMIEFTGEIGLYSQYDSRYDKTYHKATLTLYSKELVQLLTQYKLYPRKSLDLQFPELDDQYLLPFIRGFFDGDGSICRHGPVQWRVSFVGPQNFLEKLQQVINRICKISAGCITAKESIFDLEYSGRGLTDKIMRALYGTSTDENRLERKFLLYQTFLSEIAENPLCPNHVYSQDFITDAASSMSTFSLAKKYDIPYNTVYSYRAMHCRSVVFDRKTTIKPVLQISLADGSTINEFPSIPMAAKTTGVSASSIYRVTNGKLKTAGGCFWRKKESV